MDSVVEDIEADQRCSRCQEAPRAAGLRFCYACLSSPLELPLSLSRSDEFEQLEAYVSGEVVGHYEIIAKIGSGGFADVYKARKTDCDESGLFALKVLRPGMDSRDVLGRFKVEQQLLRRLHDHDGIVHFIDSGITPKGHPFFVMELVQGIPITDYCDAKRYDIRQRVRLFASVCQAIHDAHRQGVLHRDLKPANILIEEIEGQPHPRIIDFGIGKALESTGSGSTLATQLGQVLGTPNYLSPEQAAGVDEADVRSDSYSLGAVLYELVSGLSPWPEEHWQHISPKYWADELQRGVALPPSARAQANGADQKLIDTLSGDVDHIVLKAMSPERQRRYGTAAALAEDLNLWADGRPIAARPPSLMYHVGRCFRRFFWEAMIVSAIFLTAGLLGLLMIIQAKQAEAIASVERDRAKKAEAIAQKAQFHAERESYRSAINLALMQIKGNEPYLAARELRATNPALRAWEWQFLSAALPTPEAAVDSCINNPRFLVSTLSGEYAAIAGDSGLQVVNLKKGKLLNRIEFSSTLRDLAISPDGQRLAVVLDHSEDLNYELRVMSTDGVVLWTDRIPGSSSICWTGSCDELLCVSGNSDVEHEGRLALYDSRNGKIIRQRKLSRSSLSGAGIYLSSRGNYAAIRLRLDLFDIIHLPSLDSIPVEVPEFTVQINDVLIDEEKRAVYYAFGDKVYCSWLQDETFNPSSVSRSFALKLLTPVRRLNLSLDGQILASGDGWRRTESGEAEPQPIGTESLAFRLSKSRCLVALPDGRIEIRVDDPPPPATKLPVRWSDDGAEARAASFSPDSSMLVYQPWTGDSLSVSRLDENWQRFNTVAENRPSHSMPPAIHPNGEIIHGGPKGVQASQLHGIGLSYRNLPIPLGGSSCSISLSGKSVLFGMNEGLTVLDWESNTVTAKWQLSGGPFYVLPSLDDESFEAIGKDGVFHRVGSSPLSIPLSPAGTAWLKPRPALHLPSLKLAVDDGEGVSIYQLERGGKPSRLKRIALPQAPKAMAFDSTGSRLAITAVSKKLVIWDWLAELPLLELPYNASCRCIAFSPDGRWMVHTDYQPSLVIYGK